MLALAWPSAAHAVTYVRSVEYVEVNLGAGATTASINLTKGQTIANCVPFASETVSGTDNAFDQVLTDVFFQSGPARVTAQRQTAGGTVGVGVFVVEFDPAFVNVQQGTFSLFAGVASTTVGITGVNLAKAALVSYYRHGATTDSWNDLALAGWFSLANQLSYQRDTSAGAVNGHYYVFEARNAEFSVQAVSFTVPAGTPVVNAPITAVDTDKSFVIASYRTAYAADDNEDGQLGFYLSSPTSVSAERQFENSSSNLISDARVFVVTLGEDARVQRGTLTYADTDTQATAVLRPVNREWTMAWNGSSIGPGTTENEATTSSDGDTAFQRLKLATSTTVRGDRDGTCSAADCGGVGHYEIVEFKPGGAMVVKSGFYTGNNTDDRLIHVGFQPDVVLVKFDTNGQFSQVRTSTMPADASKPTNTAGGALVSNRIQSFTSQGFVVGTDPTVNSAGNPYYWVAFQAAAGELAVGSYTGNSVAGSNDNRSITGVGFQPELVWVLGNSAGAAALYRSSSMAGDTSYDFDAQEIGPPANAIQALEMDGFQVGTLASVNANGVAYHYIAWNAVPGRMAVGSYTGDNVDGRPLDVAGFFPEWVVVKRQGDTRPAVQKPASTGAGVDYSLYLSDFVGFNDNIQALRPLGFEVGGHDRVNVNPNLYYWMAFGPHVPQTNYRSIGTSLPYGSGVPAGSGSSVTVTTGSPYVTGVATTWKTSNRGRGDVITIPCGDPPACTGGVHYTILGVSADNALLLTAGYGGASASGLTYLIRRQFANMLDWEDCVDGPPGVACPFFPVTSASLVSDDRSEVGIAYKDSVFGPAELIIDGSTTDPTHTITLTADPGNRHLGIPGAGVVLDLGGASSGNGIFMDDNYVTVEWMEVRNSVPSADGIEITNIGSANKRIVRNCLVHNVGADGVQIHGANHDAEVYNNIVYRTRQGIRVVDPLNSTSVVRIYNNTVFASTAPAIAGISAVAPVAGTPVILRNNISIANTFGDFDVLGLHSTSSHNLAADGSGITHSPGGGGITATLVAVNFVNTGVGTENLHIQAGSAAQNQGTNLAGWFNTDIDAAPRVTPWDIGADELAATTAVGLMAFSGRPIEGPTGAPAVELDWSTASELDNLGFNLYRSSSADGAWTRLNPHLIPGLGFSPVGRSYSWTDTTAAPGTRAFYLLEDVETTGRTERHGPIAVDVAGTGTGGGTDGDPHEPGDGAPPDLYGEPGEPELRVVERGPTHAVLELRTPGFRVTRGASGEQSVSVRGFEPTAPGTPALPVRGTFLEGVAGRGQVLTSTEPEDLLSVSGLRLADEGAPALEVSEDGLVKASRARAPRVAAERDAHRWARLDGTAFQGETKKIRVVLSPFRYDEASGETVLARRLRVRVDFVGTAPEEKSLGGSRGRATRPAAQRGETIAAQLVTGERGLYQVRFEDVFGTTGRAHRSSRLRLSRLGQPVPYHLEPDAASFGPGSRLFFVGGGDLNPNGAAVYEVELGEPGERMPVEAAAPRGPSHSDYDAVRSFEENHYYQAGLLDAPDLWLWDILVSPSSRDYAFTVTELASTPRTARIKVWLQGGSELGVEIDHHVRVLVNGSLAGETSWRGKAPRTLEAEVPSGVLREGANTLTLECLNDTGAAYSMVFLNRFEVTHPRRSLAESGRLEGRWTESGTALVQGSSGARGAFVVDVTARERWVRGARSLAGEMRFHAEAGRSYLVVDPRALLAPQVRRGPTAGLRRRDQQADWLLVAPRAFLVAAQPLVDLRASQGLAARAVALEDVDAEFGFGEAGSAGLREFLAYAYQSWAAPSPRYVLLLGDSTYDPRNYLQTSAPDIVPFRPLRTSYLWTASDPAYASVNGDDLLPDIALGRLPAQDVGEAQRLVEKILAFEAAGGRLEGRAVLVADNADLGGAFEAEADALAADVLQHDRPVLKLYLRDMSPAALRGEIRSAFDGGAGIFSYLGHGGTAVWASENVWSTFDVPSLAAQSRQPLLVTMNCLNGFFHFPAFSSAAEALVKAEGRGAIAAFSPSGLSLDAPAHVYHESLLAEIESGRHERLGDAVLAAQEAYAASGALPELLSIYNLLGDPALTLR